MADADVPTSTAGYSRRLRDMGDGTHAEVVAAEAGFLSAGASRSGAITTAGTAQDLAAANADRKSLTVQNISAGDLWLNEIGGTAAVDATDSFKIAAGVSFEVKTNQKVSIIGATLGQKFTATET